jgi:hypothetical protein
MSVLLRLGGERDPPWMGFPPRVSQTSESLLMASCGDLILPGHERIGDRLKAPAILQ